MTNDTKIKRKVWFNRVCAVIWMLLLIPAYLWWRDSVFFVIAASVYANVKSDWSASEAADDRLVLEAISDLRKEVLGELEQLREESRDAKEAQPAPVVATAQAAPGAIED
jgi:hypothetical protein